jgi:hypothetical protein
VVSRIFSANTGNSINNSVDLRNRLQSKEALETRKGKRPEFIEGPLLRRFADIPLPAKSTIHAVLDRHGLVERRNSLSTSIGFLVVTALYTKLWIDHRRAMRITAEMMADVYNHDAYSRRVAREAIEKYNTHIEHCNRAIEAAEHGGRAPSVPDPEVGQLRSELMRVAEERDTATRERDIAREELRKKSEILAEMSVRLEALASKPGITSNPKPTPDVRSADPKLVTHINNLQEQLYAERNNNRRLRGG